MKGTYPTNDSSVWYMKHMLNGRQWVWRYTNSWTVASAYRSFLIEDYPGGYPEGSASGSSTNPYTPDSVVTGDVLFYDWGTGEGISHASIQVGIGTDPNSGYYGNLVDEHTSNRKHAFWSLYPYNLNAATTTIYFMHIASSNS